MNELLIKDDYTEIVKQYKELEYISKNIKNELENVSICFVKIGFNLLNASKLDLSKLDYVDVFDYAEDQFNIKKTSAKNMIAIAKRFCVENTYYFKLKDEFKYYSYSQLTELLTVDDSDLNNYSSESTVKEIRLQKKFNQLEFSFKNAIEDYLISFDGGSSYVRKVYSDMPTRNIIDCFYSYNFHFDSFLYSNYGSMIFADPIEEIDVLNRRYKKTYSFYFSKIKFLKFNIELVVYYLYTIKKFISSSSVYLLKPIDLNCSSFTFELSKLIEFYYLYNDKMKEIIIKNIDKKLLLVEEKKNKQEKEKKENIKKEQFNKFLEKFKLGNVYDYTAANKKELSLYIKNLSDDERIKKFRLRSKHYNSNDLEIFYTFDSISNVYIDDDYHVYKPCYINSPYISEIVYTSSKLISDYIKNNIEDILEELNHTTDK